MILVDTSVWVAHFRSTSPELQHILINNQALTHLFVLGELACGQLSKRTQTLSWMGLLPAVTLARHDDVMNLMEQRRLWGRGIGWIDAHLLASALLVGCRLWTLDQRLRDVAEQLRLA